MRFAFLLAAIVVLTASSPAKNQDAEEKAIRAMWQRFEELYNKDDAAGVAGLYAPDATRVVNDAVAIGRSEIQEQYTAEVAQMVEPLDTTITIRFLRPDVAIIDGEGVETTADGKVRYFFTVIVTKENGQWLIAAGRPRGSVPQ